MDKYKQLYNYWVNEPNLHVDLKRELFSIAGCEADIYDRFHQNLSFGTGGIRGLIGAGINRINIYTIRRVAAGIAEYLMSAGENAMQRGVVIAYDTRHLSKEFAMETAKVLGWNKIRVHLFKESRPTPQLSFAIRHLRAFAGTMITASHNPAEYNGIKVYGEDGGQLTQIPSNNIIDYMGGVKDLFSIPYAEVHSLTQNGLLTYILEDLDDSYLQSLLSLRENISVIKRHGKDLPIVYTPLHGAGYRPVADGLKACGFENVFIVQEQAIPDPKFSTVRYPNPEEAEAFELALELGREKGAELLLATDPDADRLGVAIRKTDGKYKLLSGNQLGALLLHYILSQKKRKGKLPKHGVMIKTIVTSEFGQAVASKYGVTTINTLTGFKFISEKIEEISRSGTASFLFGYEESFGYLIGDAVREKDAVQAALLTSEMTAFYQSIGKTLLEVLQDLYNEFGHFSESLKSLQLDGQEGNEKIHHILSTFRHYPPHSIAGIRVIALEDYKARTICRVGGKTEQLPLPKADILKFVLEDGSWVCVRPSGTEPKCKFYFGVKKNSTEEAQTTLRLLEKDILNRVQSIGKD